MSNELRFVIFSLACFRLAELFSVDYGPYHVFANIRSWLGRKGSGSKFWANIAEGINCPWCVGVWFATLLIIPFLLQNVVLDAIVLIFGIAGLQSLLQSLSGSKRDL